MYITTIIKSIILFIPLYFCKKEIKQTYFKIILPKIKSVFLNIIFLSDVVYFFLINSFNLFYYKHWKNHESFFNKFYNTPNDEFNITPFILATQFEAFAPSNIPVPLSFHNVRNLRSFGIYLSKKKTINLENLISFCNLPKNIIEIRIGFSPFISKNHNYIIQKGFEQALTVTR
jgi:hypothetical protein